jgi:LPS O-antigen subunit length determinant protein (WzzB/FepE family)
MKHLFLALLLSITAAAFGQKTPSTTTSTESTSVSVTSSDSNYSLSANFAINKASAVRSLIVKALGQTGENVNGETNWSLKDTYTIALSTEMLSIKMNKENASNPLKKSIIQLGKDIQYALTKIPVTEKR